MKPKIFFGLVLLFYFNVSFILIIGCKKINCEITDLETFFITNISFESAKGGGVIIYNGGCEISEKGLVWGDNPSINLKTNVGHSVIGSGAGEFFGEIDNLLPHTTYYVRSYATNSAGTGYGKVVSFRTKPRVESGSVTDIDGNKYRTVTIGNQEWMAENLRVTKYRNGESIPLTLDNSLMIGSFGIYPHAEINGLDSDEEVLLAYGALYNWYAVKDQRDLCPTGWHVPTDAEWTELIDYVVSNGYSNNNNIEGTGNILKSCKQMQTPLGEGCATNMHPRWEGHSFHFGKDYFGLSVLPGGFVSSNRIDFEDIGLSAYFWSTSQDIPDVVWMRYFPYYRGFIIRAEIYQEVNLSIRCIRD
jgi:uncharacterized protein (TIGR02145 family)